MTAIEGFRLLPCAVDGMARLAACGYELVVASNQRGIARGLVGPEVLRQTEAAIQEALEPLGARVTGFYYCPHQADDPACDCRKPKPGLLLRATSELGLDLGASWMIGDSESDVAAGSAAGCRTAYVGPGECAGATILAGSLDAVAEEICRRGSGG